MEYFIAATVATLALFVTTGTASAQHGGHGAPAHHPVAPVHQGGHVSPGHGGYPTTGFGVGVSVGPVYGGFGGYPVPIHGPVLAPAHGYLPAPHHRSHH